MMCSFLLYMDGRVEVSVSCVTCAKLQFVFVTAGIQTLSGLQHTWDTAPRNKRIQRSLYPTLFSVPWNNVSPPQIQSTPPAQKVQSASCQLNSCAIMSNPPEARMEVSRSQQIATSTCPVPVPHILMLGVLRNCFIWQHPYTPQQ